MMARCHRPTAHVRSRKYLSCHPVVLVTRRSLTSPILRYRAMFPTHAIENAQRTCDVGCHGLAASVRLNPVSPSRKSKILEHEGRLTRFENSATPLSFSTWVFFGLLFNYSIRSRFPGWWHTYNYITAAALDSGLVIATIIIFFAITLPGVDIPQWWGNVDVYNTAVSRYLSFGG